MTEKAKQVRTKSGRADKQAATAQGSPLMVSLNVIDEDPAQPRRPDNPGFTAQSIGELAASYGPKGPKTPISLRDNPASPGRYIINHGHRRYRAAKFRGMSSIPSFVDNDYNEIDQVIENLHRNELTAQEIADWIGRELAKGVKKAEIAKSIGKSPAFVSQHATLLNLPPPIASVVSNRKLNDVTVINELAKAFKTNPDEVSRWLKDEQQELTRGSVGLLREYLEQRKLGFPNVPSSDWDAMSDAETMSDVATDVGTLRPSNPGSSDRLRQSILLVEHTGRPARLNLRRRPLAVGLAWLRYEDNGEEAECNLAEVKLIALLEGNT